MSLSTAGLMLLGGGCQDPKAEVGPVRWAEPVLPLPIAAGDERGLPDPDSCGSAGPEKPRRQLVLQCMNAGRDFSEAEGVDGFVLQVTPLDVTPHAVRIVREPAEAGIVLYAPGSDTTGPKALRVWYIPSEKLDGYWGAGRMLDGYVFRLAWGETKLPAGNYQFVVRFAYLQAQAKQTICQKIGYQDQMSR